jgi:transposase-like protein
MPWSETSTVDQKRFFVADYQRGSFAMAELCRRYGVSRPTGYKWIQLINDNYFCRSTTIRTAGRV